MDLYQIFFLLCSPSFNNRRLMFCTNDKKYTILQGQCAHGMVEIRFTERGKKNDKKIFQPLSKIYFLLSWL